MERCKQAWAKRPLKPKENGAICFMLNQDKRVRDRALFDLTIDSKLRGCDLLEITIGYLVAGSRVRTRAMVSHQKTKWPVEFKLLEPALSSILAWLERRGGGLDEFAFPNRIDRTDRASARQYARLVDERITGIGLRREDYGAHSLRSLTKSRRRHSSAPAMSAMGGKRTLRRSEPQVARPLYVTAYRSLPPNPARKPA